MSSNPEILTNSIRNGVNSEETANSLADANTASAREEEIDTSNIHVSEGKTFQFKHGKDDRQTELLAEFERRKKVRSVVVPTDDSEVKARLRELGEPICLFGEGPSERRNRLREIYAQQDTVVDRVIQEPANESQSSQIRDVWYHEGPDSLAPARHHIAARDRLKAARIERAKPDPDKAAKAQELYKRLGRTTIFCSQIGDCRPISFCQFSPDCQYVATGSWSGLCKLWSVPHCEQATLTLSSKSACMASCDAEGSVKLWSLESDTPIRNVSTHTTRVSRICYHPSGRYLGSACYDHSWRLYDLEADKEVLHQEGHMKEVYCLAFQIDGSLCFSGGLDAYGRVWDLRSGRCIILLEGHLKGVLSIDSASDGYQVATASADNSVRIWDLRNRKTIYTIPAHSGLVSFVKYENNRNYLMSASYDKTAKIWSNPGWSPLQTLTGHDDKLMCLDISSDGKYYVTSCYDRTFKLWST
ncbi:U4/U6 small nuclear ribonucleoprotein Prp4 [Trichoplax sp. H2]|nr:U4/U6 small nuclear ribonucleoprotein Prp4 [Trichoplax sp. H2]|eukprot:RDD44371.1 U4/U6 small nuclear ribonucleoprotein Prp4 [Trichoplax sp. H2]